MTQYIDKDALVAEIRNKVDSYRGDGIISIGVLKQQCEDFIYSLNSLDVKEVDLDALGILAEHLIACDAHLVTPKYTDKELDLLEEWAKYNKAQKGEEV